MNVRKEFLLATALVLAFVPYLTAAVPEMDLDRGFDLKAAMQSCPSVSPASRPAPLLPQPAVSVMKAGGNFSMLFFDEYGDGAMRISAELKKYGIAVLYAENLGQTTFVSYKADKQLIQLAETREYGAGNVQGMVNELEKITAELKTAGKIVIWVSRWTEILKSGATVYYLDAPVIQ